MRKGYWKILLRRLRGRMASGADTFLFRQARFTLTEILASDDDALDPAAELPLAATADGTRFFIDTCTNMVGIGIDGASASEATGLDLPGFIDALTAGAPVASGIGLTLDDTDIPEIDLPQRKPLLGD